MEFFIYNAERVMLWGNCFCTYSSLDSREINFPAHSISLFFDVHVNGC